MLDFNAPASTWMPSPGMLTRPEVSRQRPVSQGHRPKENYKVKAAENAKVKFLVNAKVNPVFQFRVIFAVL